MVGTAPPEAEDYLFLQLCIIFVLPVPGHAWGQEGQGVYGMVLKGGASKFLAMLTQFH